MTIKYWALTKEQREQVYAMFPATTMFRSTHRPMAHDDYVYEVAEDGKVLNRTRLADYELEYMKQEKR